MGDVLVAASSVSAEDDLAVAANTDYANASAAVQSALLADANAALEAALSKAQETLAKEEADVAEVNGLAAAISNYQTALENQEAAVKANTAADAKLAGKTAEFNALGYKFADTTAVTATNAIEQDADTKEWSLADGVTEEKFPGVTELLNAANAEVAAQAAVDSANSVVAATSKSVNLLDPSATVTAELGTVGAGFSATTPDNAAEPTQTEITAELNALKAAIVPGDGNVVVYAEDGTASLEAEADGSPVVATSEVTAYNDFNTLVNALDTELEAGASGPLYTDLKAAQQAISSDDPENNPGIQDLIDQLATAVEEEAAVQADVDTLESLNDNIEAAEQAFADLDLELPVTLQSGSNLATAENDVFVVGEATESTITNFGIQGEDALYIGTDFTLNTGELAKDGDDSVLEVFFSQSGADAVISLETKAYGSSEAAVAENVITLTGVNADNLSLSDDGFITVA